ncbi:hypothetical protein DERP_011532 [Dermatophagoides pteronyssinus]|uniref:Uncharacterized protein n=1 Tax=Dermatophagoides pteronyssinus TaxID=6956 RepID=A0ABQ8JCN8_DERPT|nr:hypothetical protein DERP_011532 [Dermatophagoides pteronyssinus]
MDNSMITFTNNNNNNNKNNNERTPSVDQMDLTIWNDYSQYNNHHQIDNQIDDTHMKQMEK